jgi:hypothetical protein
MAAGPSVPSPVAVGESTSATYTITAISPNTGNAGDCEFIKIGAGDTIEAVLSCGASAAGAPPQLCPSASTDAGVFSLPAAGTMLAGAGACSGTSFTISAADAGGTTGGHVTFTASGTFTLQSLLFPGGTGSCTFSIPTTVLKEPTKDSQAAAGLQTNQFGFATGTGFQTDGTSLVGSTNGTGTSVTTVGQCQVAVDKEVSCDGGVTWFDVNLPETANQDGTNGCIAAAGTNNIKFQYRIKNTDASFTVTSCTLTDSNGSISVPALTGVLPITPGSTTSFVQSNTLTCNSTNFGGGNQTDTATLNCTCSGAPAGFRSSNTATDSAETGCCGATLNKEISCDGGTTFFNGTNGQGTPPPACVGAVGTNDILAKYVTTNNGTITPVCGPITDSNTVLSTTTATECMTTHGVSEPDTAQETCTCSLTGAADFTLTAKSSNNFDCCGVAVDKQVSCDGGTTWNDAGLETANNDGTNGCTANSGATVNFRYFAQNTGSTALSCSFTDMQTGTGGISIFTIPSGISLAVGAAQSQLNSTAVTETCSATFAAHEPNSGAISCTCADTAGPITNVSAFDEATVNCLTPGVSISKTCADQSSGTNAVTTTVTNSGATGLTGCTVTDTTFANNSTCPATNTSNPITVPVTPATFDLSTPGGMQTSTGTVSGLTADACNSASVTCTVAGTSTTVSASATAVCHVPATGCFTRTPGFWGTHPDVTQSLLPLPSCGITLTTTTAQLPGSATEDLCGTGGRDFKPNNTSPQQLQLIRQCTAAALNLAVSQQAGLSCENSFPGITAAFNTCCVGTGSVCDSGLHPAQIDASGCEPFLDAFNNQFDTTPFPAFLVNGPAEPDQCKISNGDGFVNPGRSLGPPK